MENTHITLKSEIKRIQEGSRNALQEEWHNLLGRKAPHRCSMDILRGNLILKARDRYGEGLTEETKKQLRQMYEKFNKDPNYLAPYKRHQDIRPGTKFIREWHGEVYEVMVLDKGYEYRGHLYNSLSEITRLITGTRWNGKKFFGFNHRNKSLQDS